MRIVSQTPREEGSNPTLAVGALVGTGRLARRSSGSRSSIFMKTDGPMMG